MLKQKEICFVGTVIATGMESIRKLFTSVIYFVICHDALSSWYLQESRASQVSEEVQRLSTVLQVRNYVNLTDPIAGLERMFSFKKQQGLVLHFTH